jgi:PAS domain S-box-containing protein
MRPGLHERKLDQVEADMATAADGRADGYAARLEADLAGMRRLYELQAKLAFETDLKAALGEIVAAAAEFTGTDRGCVQLLSEDGEQLEMFVHRGYGPDSGFVRHFLFQGSKPACDAARQDQRRILIDDVASFPALLGTEDRRVALAEDIRATQSTPMVSRKGELVGVLSTQFRQPHRPGEHELKLIDMLAWTAADFVDRHLTEAALRRANEARHRRTLEIDTVPVVFFDMVGGITDANDAFLDMIGYTRAELAAGELRYENLTPPDWAWRDERTKAELLDTGKSEPFEKEYFRRDGSRIWIFCAGKMLEGSTAVEFIIDVTERKRAEQALAESERRARSLVEGVPQLVWRAFDGGKWSWASPQWSAFTGKPERASHGMGWLETIHPTIAAPPRRRGSEPWKRAGSTWNTGSPDRMAAFSGSPPAPRPFATSTERSWNGSAPRPRSTPCASCRRARACSSPSCSTGPAT